MNILRNDLLTGLAMGQRPKMMRAFTDPGKFRWRVLRLALAGEKGISLHNNVGSGADHFTLAIVFTYRRKDQKNAGAGNRGYRIDVLHFHAFYFYPLTRYEPFSSRLLSPLFIPLIWTLSWWIPGLLSTITKRYQWIYTGVVLFPDSLVSEYSARCRL
jgi:hypothetical protein